MCASQPVVTVLAPEPMEQWWLRAGLVVREVEQSLAVPAGLASRGTSWEAAAGSSGAGGPATHAGDLQGVPTAWLGSALALATAGICPPFLLPLLLHALLVFPSPPHAQ